VSEAGDVVAAYQLLGLEPGAGVAAIRQARKLLARRAHPDVGGSEEQMRSLNAAVDTAVRSLRQARLAQSATPSATSDRRTHAADQQARQPRRSASMWQQASVGERWALRDDPSFTIDVLPAAAFEALLIVTSWFGDVIDDEPPYQLDVHLFDPSECAVRFTLVPDAGASTVSIQVVPVAPSAPPTAEAVRDLFVSGLNQLGAAE
jgi:hypothetical protein